MSEVRTIIGEIRRELPGFMQQGIGVGVTPDYFENMLVRIFERLQGENSTPEKTPQEMAALVSAKAEKKFAIFFEQLCEEWLYQLIEPVLNEASRASIPNIAGGLIAALNKEAEDFLHFSSNVTAETADHSYAVRMFHQLAERYLEGLPQNAWPTDDIGAIAHTAQAHFALSVHAQSVHSMAKHFYDCLSFAIKEERQKSDFPAFNYDQFFASLRQKADRDLGDYKTGYDPEGIFKLTERVFTKALFRVRALESEVFDAIREFDEAVFRKWKTRDDFIDNVAKYSEDTRRIAIESLDRDLAELPEKTPEAIEHFLEQRREGMLNGYARTVFSLYQDLSDHGVRCGIAATVFAAAHYSDAHYQAISGASKEDVHRLRPSASELKESVAAYFADWLTEPLITRGPGRLPSSQNQKDRERDELERKVIETILELFEEDEEISSAKVAGRLDIKGTAKSKGKVLYQRLTDRGCRNWKELKREAATIFQKRSS
ncbi:MAG: hypothetical protein HOP19_29745 [Acidobacteria bacterium]|nr:hypothetical protein [Acidobacteriota bacterium]